MDTVDNNSKRSFNDFLNDFEKFEEIMWNGLKVHVDMKQLSSIIYNQKGGIRYEGGWENGQPNGDGIHYYSNGTKRYEGSLINNIENGYGVLYYISGVIHYKGYWINGQQNGQGRSYSETG